MVIAYGKLHELKFEVLPAGLCDDHFCAEIMELFPEFGHLEHTL